MINTEVMKRTCDELYKLAIKEEENEFAKYTIKDLEDISSIRQTGFLQQVYTLSFRIITSFIRAPIFVWAIFGNAFFTTLLIASIYKDTG